MGDIISKALEMEEEAKLNGIKTEFSDPVQQFENEYPELSFEFKVIQKEMYDMFARKHMDYGLNNIALGGDILNNKEVIYDWFYERDYVPTLSTGNRLGRRRTPRNCPRR